MAGEHGYYVEAGRSRYTDERRCVYCGKMNGGDWYEYEHPERGVVRWHPDVQERACIRCRAERPFTPSYLQEKAEAWIDQISTVLKKRGARDTLQHLHRFAEEMHDAQSCRRLRKKAVEVQAWLRDLRAKRERGAK